MNRKYNMALLQLLADSYCPNDVLISDQTPMCDCYSGEDCLYCWEESLDRLERKQSFKDLINEVNIIRNSVREVLRED